MRLGSHRLGSEAALAGGTIAVLLVVVAMPLGMVVLQAIFPDLSKGIWATALSHWPLVLADAHFLEALGNTLALGGAVCLVSLLLAAPLACARGLYEVPGGKLWDVLLLIPFMMPPYIGAMAWTFALQPRGYSDQLFGFSADKLLFSFPGIVLVMSLHLFPLVYFALSRTLRTLGWRYVDAARVCGATSSTWLLKVVAPLSLPTLAASLLMVFSLAIEEYGTPALLGRPAQFVVLVTRIEEKLAEWPIDLAGSALLSAILLFMAAGAYALHHRILARRSYAVVLGRQGATRPLRLSGSMQVIALGGFAAVVMLAVLVPLAAMMLTALTRTLSGGLSWENMSLMHFASVWADEQGALGALVTSWALAGLTALLAGALGMCTAYVVVRSPGRARHAVGVLSAVPNALPGMVLAVGLILLWNRSGWPVQVYGTSVVLILAYLCLLLPYPVRYVSNALAQIASSLDGAGRVSGASSAQVFTRILAPLVSPHLFIAMLLVFAIASRELVASVMLAPPGVKTVSTYIFNQFAQGSPNEGMALAFLAIGLSTGFLVAANLWADRS